jgi:hypothetical protein
MQSQAGTPRVQEQARIAAPQAIGAGRVWAGYAIVAGMVLGAVSLFTLVPLVCLWLASLITGSSSAGVILALFSVPLAMVLVGSELGRLDRLHARVTRRPGGRRIAPAYRRGVTDTRNSNSTTVLEGVMVASVVIAGGIYLAWFFLLAGSPLPA